MFENVKWKDANTNVSNPKQINSRAFYVIKAFAILCVIFAHCTYKTTPLAQKTTNLIGIIGVPIFLISSGLFFNIKEDAKNFWRKKFKGIVVPWIVFGILTYFISVVTGNPFGLLNLLLWVVGYGTWLYYVTILLLYYLLFRTIKWDGLPYLMIVVWIVSIILDAFGINPLSNLIGSFLNIFSRIGFFAIGILLRKSNLLDVKSPQMPIKIILTIATIGIGTTIIIFDKILIVQCLLKLIYVLFASAILFFCPKICLTANFYKI